MTQQNDKSIGTVQNTRCILMKQKTFSIASLTTCFFNIILLLLPNPVDLLGSYNEILHSSSTVLEAATENHLDDNSVLYSRSFRVFCQLIEESRPCWFRPEMVFASPAQPPFNGKSIIDLSSPFEDDAHTDGLTYQIVTYRNPHSQLLEKLSFKRKDVEEPQGCVELSWFEGNREQTLLASLTFKGTGQTEIQHLFFYDNNGRICRHTLKGNLSGTPNQDSEVYSTSIYYDEDDAATIRLVGDDGTVSTVRETTNVDGEHISWVCIEGNNQERYRKCIRECEEVSNTDTHSYTSEIIEDDSSCVTELFPDSFTWRKYSISTIRENNTENLKEETIETWSYTPHSNEKIFLRKLVIQTNRETGVMLFQAFDETGTCIYSSPRGFPQVKNSPKTADFFFSQTSKSEHESPFIKINGLGHIVSISEQNKTLEDRVEEFLFDSFGNLTHLQQKAIDQAKNRPTRTEIRARYTARKQIALKQFEDGSKEAYRYYLNGNLAKHTSRDGYVIEYGRDGLGRIAETVRRKRGTTESKRRTLSYDTRGNVVRITNEQEQLEEKFSYDIFDRLISYSRHIKDQENSRCSIVYDALDRPVAIEERRSAFDSMTTTITYDLHGQKKESRSSIKKDGREENSYLREVFNLSTGLLQEELLESSLEGVSKQIIYDNKGRKSHIRISSLTNIFDPLEYTFSYGEGELCRDGMTTKTYTQTTYMPNGSFSHEVFDLQDGRLLSKTVEIQPRNIDSTQQQKPLRIHEEYISKDTFGSYDVVQESLLSNGKKIKKTISWIFGPHKRLLSRISSDGIEEIYSYDNHGNLVEKKKTGIGSLLYQRNQHGQIERLHSSDLLVDYRYTYDTHGRIIKVHDAITNKIVTRCFDKHGRLVRDGQEGKDVCVQYTIDDNSEYNPLTASKVSSIMLPNDEIIEFDYNQQEIQRPLYIKKYSKEICEWTLKTGVAPTLKEKYVFEGIDANGHKKITKKSSLSYKQEDLNTVHTSEWKQSAHIDSFGFLAQEKGIFSYSTSFLPSGEITAFQNENSPSIEQNLEIDELGRVIRKNDLFFSYDPRGNIQTTQQGEEGSPTSYTYDLLGRLISIENYETGYKERYEYDGLHRIQRIIKTTVKKSDTQEKNYETIYIDRLWYSHSDVGFLTYSEEHQLIQSALRIPSLSTNHHETLAIEINKHPYLTTVDSNHSIIALFDSNGDLAEKYFYSFFGDMKQISHSGSQIGKTDPLSPWLWCGKKRCGDNTLPLYDFGYRRYSTKLMHWLEEDLLGWSDGIHTRSYVHNNPAFGVDPTGLFSIPSYWNLLIENIQKDGYEVYMKMMKSLTFASTSVDWFFQFRYVFEDMILRVINSTWLTLIGYNPDATHIGRVGTDQEPYSKVRITHINGILNGSNDQVDNAALVSKTHGNIPVHYIYAATSGFTGDILRCICAKGGLISRNAKLLAQLWKRLLSEMGGAHEGGVIIHYAHSLGGTDTASALNILTPEERACIRVVTFGSATLLQEGTCSKVDNYISVNDGVPMLDIKSYFYGFMGWQNNIYFMPSNTLPVVDHLFTNEVYRKVLDELGAKFQEEFLKEQKDRNKLSFK